MTYFQSSDNDFILYCGDSQEQLTHIEQQFDMIFADPPYFLSTGNGKVNINGQYVKFDKGNWDKVKSRSEKDTFNKKWLLKCCQKLKPYGTIWVCGTYHNIFSIEKCLDEVGFKIINMIVWQKTDPPVTLSEQRFNFSAEYIIWATRKSCKNYKFNYDVMKRLNGDKQMTDVWRLSAVGLWEKTCGKHPTQKPLKLLYRIILASTNPGDVILDPFAGSCTTGVAANLLGRNFIGIDQEKEYLDMGRRRGQEIRDAETAQKMLRKMSESSNESMVLVNHATADKRKQMIEKGICYLRAGESKGSLQIVNGFEKMKYVLLHTNGNDCQIFKLKKEGTFQIWTKENLEKQGFHPEHAAYYIVLHFDNTQEVKFEKVSNIKERLNTYRAKIRPLSDFIELE